MSSPTQNPYEASAPDNVDEPRRNGVLWLVIAAGLGLIGVLLVLFLFTARSTTMSAPQKQVVPVLPAEAE